MNRKGITALMTMMITVTIIVVALALAGPVKDFVEQARAPDSATLNGLDCGNTSISDYDSGACIITDLYTPGFIGVLIGIAMLIITARVVFR